MQFATKFLCTVGLLALASGNLIDVKKHKPAILAKQTPAHVEIDKIETEMELKGIELEEIKHPGHVRPSDVEYAGGPIMHVANLHNIFFGGWNSETVNIITDFTSNLANTPYFNTITTYYDANGYIRNDTAILKSTTFVNDNFLGDPVTALNSVLDNFLVPEETDGLYNLFFNGVIPPLFAELGACGFHDWTTRNGKQIIYTVQTNPLQVCPYHPSEHFNFTPLFKFYLFIIFFSYILYNVSFFLSHSSGHELCNVLWTFWRTNC